mmetsp:Transcript_34723/g.74028  ORF Transcript_34723/g.74028 Transcript_34723/m.74028 type:complete len:214 (-) Transcript_34723:265-906(-)
MQWLLLASRPSPMSLRYGIANTAQRNPLPVTTSPLPLSVTVVRHRGTATGCVPLWCVPARLILDALASSGCPCQGPEPFGQLAPSPTRCRGQSEADLSKQTPRERCCVVVRPRADGKKDDRNAVTIPWHGKVDFGLAIKGHQLLSKIVMRDPEFEALLAYEWQCLLELMNKFPRRILQTELSAAETADSCAEVRTLVVGVFVRSAPHVSRELQ